MKMSLEVETNGARSVDNKLKSIEIFLFSTKCIYSECDNLLAKIQKKNIEGAIRAI